MSTRMAKELSYRATPDEVRAMLLDPAFREEVLAQQGVLRGEVEVEGDVVRIEQVMAARGIPSYASKFVGDEITIVQEETWRDHSADIAVAIPGKPGRMTGTVRIEDRQGTTVEVVELSIDVSLPLVGGKIERLIAEIMERALDHEHAAGTRYLDR